jgi:hypothetical protein
MKQNHPKYPVYIISKGRAETRKTSKALEQMGIAYRIVIEAQEYDQYAAVIDEKKILVLPFSNLGLGSYPARNWCWNHAISEGHAFHWILDDNIHGFARLYKNKRIPCKSGAIFRAAEDFTDRYENVAQAGFQYRFFAEERTDMPAFRLNTRIFSCILIRNDLPHRWKLKYNEDVALSLDVLKDGWCTIIFNAFLQDKAATLSMKGGNTTELYADGDKKKEKSQTLVDAYPDYASLAWRYDRWHHRVDFDVFKKNILKKKQNLAIPEGINEFGMKLVARKTHE